jgi:predicted MFS family arabinose efflux permease
VRARTLAIYLVVMAGGYTVGSVVWGRVADACGVRFALTAAGACVLVNAAVLLTGRRENPI